jgi:cytochrome c2
MAAPRTWIIGAIVGLGIAVARLDAGGWAVVTMGEVPDHMVEGRPVTVTYSVRQHGVSLTPGLSGHIEARSESGVIVKARASAGGEPGFYVATLTLPAPGTWTLTIVSGFLSSQSAPVPMRVIAVKDRSPQLADADRGARLFAAKGCVMCHSHVAVPAPPGFAPNLSIPRFAPAFLKAFLADPSIKPRTMPNAEMPDLGLNDDEISALVAFLSTPPNASNAVASR